MSYYFFKVMIDQMLDDAEIGALENWVWRYYWQTYAAAREAGQDGLIPPLAKLAWRIRANEKKLADALEVMRTVGLVEETDRGMVLTRFEGEQAPVPDTVRKRMSRDCHADVTKRDVDIEPEVEKDNHHQKAALDAFVEAFGKFHSVQEFEQYLALVDEHGMKRVKEVMAWGVKRKIHLENRPALLDSLETAAGNWKEKSNEKRRRTKERSNGHKPAGKQLSADGLEALRKQAERDFVCSPQQSA